MSALESFARRVLHPEDLGHAVTDEVRGAARQALLDSGLQLPLGSVTAPYPEDSACSSGGAPPPEFDLGRLALLSSETREVPALLLCSFHKTHQDVLRQQRLDVWVVNGRRIAVVDLYHVPSSRTYQISAVAISQDAGSMPPVERIGECEICGDIDHHLREGTCVACRRRFHALTGASR